MKRTTAAMVASETLGFIAQGWYQSPRGQRIEIANDVEWCVQATELVRPGDWASIRRKAEEMAATARHGTTVVEVTAETTLAAARRLAADGQGVLALNFASGKNPGGGFLNGSRAQEESIARSSALYPSLLTKQAYYDANRGGPRGIYTDHAIYSPRVPVIRSDDGELLDEPYNVSVFTMPAPNRRALEEGGRSADEALIRETFVRRIACVLAFAAVREYRTLVLGAWGCGAFRNDPEMVAGLFADALATPIANCFERVVFAVFDGLDGQPVLNAFRERLSGAGTRG